MPPYRLPLAFDGLIAWNEIASRGKFGARGSDETMVTRS